MAAGFYDYCAGSRRSGKGVSEKQNALIDHMNELAMQLLELRKKADEGDVKAMIDANEIISKITESRVALETDGVRTRFDSDENKFVIS